MHTVYATDDIEIVCDQKGGTKAVVSFSGVGLNVNMLQTGEFHKTLAESGTVNYFVMDKRRHWYNSSFDIIASTLNRHFAETGISDIMTLGNSMGGFGAAIFAGSLNGCRRALCIAPQSAIDPSIVPWEHRWRQYTASVTHWNGLDTVNRLSPDVSYTFIFGGDGKADARHAMRLSSADPKHTAVFLIFGAHHNVAAYLRSINILTENRSAPR